MKVQEIVSPTHPLVKYFVKLRADRTFRHEQQKVLVSGEKFINELKNNTAFFSLIIDCDFSHAILPQAHRVYKMPRELLKKITALPEPPHLVAEVAIPSSSNLIGKNRVIILEDISDPGNLGTLIRTALALNWEGIFITEGSADPFNDKALRAACGATFKLPYRLGSHEELRQFLQTDQFTHYVADIHGQQLQPNIIQAPLTLTLGNEARGPSKEVKRYSRGIRIPMNSQVESLNVAVAGAILMYALGEYATF